MTEEQAAKTPASGHGEKPDPWDDGPAPKPGHDEKPAPRDVAPAVGQVEPKPGGEKPDPWDDAPPAPRDAS